MSKWVTLKRGRASARRGHSSIAARPRWRWCDRVRRAPCRLLAMCAGAELRAMHRVCCSALAFRLCHAIPYLAQYALISLRLDELVAESLHGRRVTAV